MNTETADSRHRIHTFEAAGLGTAPFQIVGFGDKGSCKFCGRVLNSHAIVQDSTGKQFKVGEDCALRTGDDALILKVKAGRKERNRANRQAKAAAAAETERTRLYAEATRIAAEFGLKTPVRPVADLSKWAGEENRLRCYGETDDAIAEARAEFVEIAEFNAAHYAVRALDMWLTTTLRSGPATPRQTALRALDAQVRAFRIANEYRPYG